MGIKNKIIKEVVGQAIKHPGKAMKIIEKTPKTIKKKVVKNVAQKAAIAVIPIIGGAVKEKVMETLENRKEKEKDTQ